MWSKLLCYNCTSADLPFHCSDVDAVLQDLKCCCGVSLCLLQSVQSTEKKAALNPETVHVLDDFSHYFGQGLSVQGDTGEVCSDLKSLVWQCLLILGGLSGKNHSLLRHHWISRCVNLFCVWLSKYFLPTWADFPLFSPFFFLGFVRCWRFLRTSSHGDWKALFLRCSV